MIAFTLCKNPWDFSLVGFYPLPVHSSGGWKPCIQRSETSVKVRLLGDDIYLLSVLLSYFILIYCKTFSFFFWKAAEANWVCSITSGKRITVLNKLLHPVIELKNVRITCSHISGKCSTFQVLILSSSKNTCHIYTPFNSFTPAYFSSFLPSFLADFFEQDFETLCWIMLNILSFPSTYLRK